MTVKIPKWMLRFPLFCRRRFIAVYFRDQIIKRLILERKYVAADIVGAGVELWDLPILFAYHVYYAYTWPKNELDAWNYWASDQWKPVCPHCGEQGPWPEVADGNAPFCSKGHQQQ